MILLELIFRLVMQAVFITGFHSEHQWNGWKVGLGVFGVLHLVVLADVIFRVLRGGA